MSYPLLNYHILFTTSSAGNARAGMWVGPFSTWRHGTTSMCLFTLCLLRHGRQGLDEVVPQRMVLRLEVHPRWGRNQLGCRCLLRRHRLIRHCLRLCRLFLLSRHHRWYLRFRLLCLPWYRHPVCPPPVEKSVAGHRRNHRMVCLRDQ